MKDLNQKIYAIVNKETKEIIHFSLTPSSALKEWQSYFLGTEDEQTHELKQTFMSQNEIKSQMNLS